MNPISLETIPPFVSYVTRTLQQAGFESYLVGGCVRDMVMGKTPKDWDITTNARPEQIQEVFNTYKTIYENTFGTVSVINIAADAENREVTRGTSASPSAINAFLGEEVQITTYRSEDGYADNRHPDNVTYETSLTKDLERRDFTINALAFDPHFISFDGSKGQIIDVFNGLSDIKDKTIRAVLEATKRFEEDALRMMRAVRFSTVLDFSIASETMTALVDQSSRIAHVSNERIRDELIKIILSPRPALGITLLEKTGLLGYTLPELLDGIGCEQKGAHIYDVYQHLLHALQHAADKEFSLEIRLAALFHDIGKPATRRYDRNKDKYTFFGHEVVGARMTKKIMERMNFSRVTTNLVVSLVRNHMFFSDTEQITLSAVRRIIQKVSPEHIWELMQIRECDRVGMKKAEAPYRLRKYHAMIDEALRDPISVGQLAIDGEYLIKTLHMKPGPRMGWILHALLEEVLDNPLMNTIEKLHERALDLEEQDDVTLKAL
ncbi:HD domain-containing protein, partial [Patescibacteria group bacterium]|nr:HD domain-containing protein [Patescibacteria group bacterium]